MHKTKNFLKPSVKAWLGHTFIFLASVKAGIFLVKKRIPILSELPPLSHSARFLRGLQGTLRITLISPTLLPGISDQTTKKEYCWSLAALLLKAQLWLYEVRENLHKTWDVKTFHCSQIAIPRFWDFFEALLTEMQWIAKLKKFLNYSRLCWSS